MSGVGQARTSAHVRAWSVHPSTTDMRTPWRHVRLVPKHKVAAIGIGGSLAAPPLPHHRTYGSVYGGSRSYANAPRSNDSTRVGWAFGLICRRERFDVFPSRLPGFTRRRRWEVQAQLDVQPLVALEVHVLLASPLVQAFSHRFRFGLSVVSAFRHGVPH